MPSLGRPRLSTAGHIGVRALSPCVRTLWLGNLCHPSKGQICCLMFAVRSALQFYFTRVPKSVNVNSAQNAKLFSMVFSPTDCGRFLHLDAGRMEAHCTRARLARGLVPPERVRSMESLGCEAGNLRTVPHLLPPHGDVWLAVKLVPAWHRVLVLHADKG